MKFKAIFDRNRFKNKEEEAPERLTSEEELELEGKLPGVCEKGVLRTENLVNRVGEQSYFSIYSYHRGSVSRSVSH